MVLCKDNELERFPYGFGRYFSIHGPQVTPEQAKEIITAIDAYYKGDNYECDERAQEIKEDLGVPSMDDYYGIYSLADFCEDFKAYKKDHNLLILESPIWTNRALLRPDHPDGWIDFEGNIFCDKKLREDEFVNPYDIAEEMNFLGKRFPFLEITVSIYPPVKKEWKMPQKSLLLKDQDVTIIDYKGPKMYPESFEGYNDEYEII